LKEENKKRGLRYSKIKVGIGRKTTEPMYKTFMLLEEMISY